MIRAMPGVAVREFPLQTGAVDYLLYADGRAIATVEAKATAIADRRSVD